MAGGCFDLLHAGHIAYLQAARDLGDALVVAVNDDASVRRLKGPSRPLVPIEDRVRVLQALECVDAVEVFADSTPERVLSRLRPEIFAKGGDYSGSTIPETQVVRSYGGQVVILPHLEGRSSSRLVHAARTEQGVPTKEENTCQTQTA
jgi:rfaE bifunctional protein nucleotidyltransferase chain/domain